MLAIKDVQSIKLFFSCLDECVVIDLIFNGGRIIHVDGGRGGACVPAPIVVKVVYGELLGSFLSVWCGWNRGYFVGGSGGGELLVEFPAVVSHAL